MLPNAHFEQPRHTIHDRNAILALTLPAIASMGSFSALLTSSTNLATDVRRCARALFPLGIAARITIALASVAVLATAANVLGEKSVSYIRVHSRAAQQAPAVIIARPPEKPQTTKRIGRIAEFQSLMALT